MAVARPAVVGGFVLGALALTVAAVIFFGGTRLFTKTARAIAFFSGSVAGLEVGAPVTFRGVRVGSVQRVALQVNAAGEPLIPVTIEILPGQVTFAGEEPRNGRDMAQFVAAGLKAQLNMQSIVTGQLRVDLDFVPGAAGTEPQTVDGLPVIPTVPSDLERLRSTLADVPFTELAQRAEYTLDAVDQLATQLNAELGPLLATTRRGLEAGTSALETLQQGVPQLQTEVTQVLQRLDGLADSAQRQVDDRGAELSRVLASADRTVQQADALVGSVGSLTAPRSPFRGNLEAAARDIAASAASLRSFAQTIERNPSAVLRGTGR